MTDATNIQVETKAFRDQVAEWSESKLRKEGKQRAIPGSDTLDKTTLREAIVQDWRSDRRTEATFQPQVLPSRSSELGSRHGPRSKARVGR